MPTNLSHLPSNLPVPNNRVQIKRGVGEMAVNFNTATAAGTIVPDNAGGNMQISYTPRYQCYWIVHTMRHGSRLSRWIRLAALGSRHLHHACRR